MFFTCFINQCNSVTIGECMTITLNNLDSINSSYNFTSRRSSNSAQPAQTSMTMQAAEEAPKKQRKSLWQGFRDACAGVQKFFIKAGEYTKGTVKGLLGGAAAAGAVLGGSALVTKINDLRMFGHAIGYRTVLKAPFKVPGKAKVAAAVLGVGILAANVFKSYLNSNEKGADVDHRWNTGHKDK